MEQITTEKPLLPFSFWILSPDASTTYWGSFQELQLKINISALLISGKVQVQTVQIPLPSSQTKLKPEVRCPIWIWTQTYHWSTSLCMCSCHTLLQTAQSCWARDCVWIFPCCVSCRAEMLACFHVVADWRCELPQPTWQPLGLQLWSLIFTVYFG